MKYRIYKNTLVASRGGRRPWVLYQVESVDGMEMFTGNPSFYDTWQHAIRALRRRLRGDDE